jgi:hypothetical protein
MRNRNRGFSAESFELEGRKLLTGVHHMAPAPASMLPPTPFVGFSTTETMGDLGTRHVEVVAQQAGKVTLPLARLGSTTGETQVRVTTEPSPAVGVNVPPVDQTVTFADGQDMTYVTIPVTPGAPNPGAVDVILDVQPVAASAGVASSPLSTFDLRVVASDPAAPPKVVSAIVTFKGGIQLSFNKPMDATAASNVKNLSCSPKIGPPEMGVPR